MRLDTFIQILKKFPGECEVVIAADSEGNNFYEVDPNPGIYLMSPHNGDVIDEMDLKDADTAKNYNRVVIIWPVT